MGGWHSKKVVFVEERVRRREHGGNIMRIPRKKVVFVVERVRRGSMEEIS